MIPTVKEVKEFMERPGGEGSMVKVIARCIGCSFKREIGAGEIKKGDHPMCPKCYMPLVAESAVAS